MALLYCWSGAAGTGSGADWTNAKTTLTAAFVTEVAGDTIFVAHDHSEATGSAVVFTSSGTLANPTKIICVNRAGAVPPVSADRRTTAQVATTGNFSISTGGSAHYDGIIFVAGNSTGTANLNLGSSNTLVRFDNCLMSVGTTGSGGIIQSSASSFVEFNNTKASFANASQGFTTAGAFKWRNTPSALVGTIPTILFNSSSSAGSIECIGVDLSAAGSGKTLYDAASATAGVFRLIDCKLNALVTQTLAPTSVGPGAVDLVRSGSSGVNYAIRSHRISGLLIEETTIVRSGGASDGTTPISWKIVTTASCHYSVPFECPPIAIWNDVDGSAVTATVEGIWGGGAVPLDDEIWLEVEYLGDNASPQGSFVSDGKANLLATAANQTSSTETWGGSTTKFKLAVTFTPQQVGWIYARVKCAKASSTFYIDPLVTLT